MTDFHTPNSRIPDANVIRVALAQTNPLVGAITANAESISNAIQRAKESYVPDIIVFPELSITAYPPEDLLYREGFIESARAEINKILPLSESCDIVLGLPILEGTNIFNVAFHISKGVIKIYKKQELPNYGVFDEKRYFTAGAAPLLIDIKQRKIAISICEDIWQSKVMQQAAEAGADAMINMNASPFHMHKHQQRIANLQQRIKENAMPIFYVNQIGGQDELVFDGHSLIMNQQGECVAEAESFSESLLVVDWHPDDSIQLISQHQPQSDELADIYNALVLGIKDYVTKNGFAGVVLGLSGGIDSALTLALAADALDGENVEAIMMPSAYTSQMSLDDAAEIAKNFGVNYETIAIQDMQTAYLKNLEPLFVGLPEDATEENIQSRIRGALLMAVSNKKRRLVLATGNKSEMAVGYATLYGDMCGGFAPLKDVSKTLVYQLSEWRNAYTKVNNLSTFIPERIITRPPSAELKPNQVDQDSLPPYDILDEILALYLEENLSAKSIIAKGFEKATVLDILRKVDVNEYKRRQAAPGVKITKQAFGRERRYPITSGYREQG